MVKHIFASPPSEFENLWSGVKKSDWRKYRQFEVGDTADIMEYDLGKKEYTGRWIIATITYIQISPKLNMPDGYCILNFEIKARRCLSDTQIERLGRVGFKDNIQPSPNPTSNVRIRT